MPTFSLEWDGGGAEDVFAFALTQDEGDFAKLSVEVKNPKVGLLGPGRPLWATLSADADELFYGRLVGIPTSIFREIVTLEFVARPADYAEQKSVLAATLKVHPFWDPLFVAHDQRGDPDLALEARTELWHVDRVSHDLTVSDVLQGEDGTLTFGPNDIFYDSLELTLNNIPLRRVNVEATIPWTQFGTGSLDLTDYIIRNWPNEIPGKHYISSFTFQGIVSGWPREDRPIGDGWVALPGSDCVLTRKMEMVSSQMGGGITMLNKSPLIPLMFFPTSVAEKITTNATVNATFLPSYGTNAEITYLGNVIVGMYDRYVANDDFRFHEHTTAATSNYSHDEHGRITSTSSSVSKSNPFIPLGKMIPTLIVGADAKRPRSELISFTVEANVQPVVTMPGEDEVLDLKLTAADASEPIDEGDTEVPIGDARSRSYITQPRGLQSLEYCIAVARANLIIRSRVVEITFNCKFERMLDVTLRKNAAITDPRLPGGTATGKIVSTSISLNGDDGQLNCSVTIGCAVGYGGSVAASPGLPHYVDQDYVDDEYQEFEGAVKVIDGGVGSIGYGVPMFASNDDGIDFFRGLSIEQVMEEPLTVTGSPAEQRAKIAAAYSTFMMSTTLGFVNTGISSPEKLKEAIQEAIKEDEEFETRMRLKLVPLSRAFQTVFDIETTALELPKQIDLEAPHAGP